jgi:phosphoribosylaminoimidazole-succinocarboxamide synthase
MSIVVRETDIPGLKRFATGKVRDVYDLGNALLIVATDRISAFDSVMPTGIPDKGRVLTQLSRFWFLHVSPFLANHYITVDDGFIATRLEDAGVKMTPGLRETLAGRSMLALKAKALPVECVVRGYLAGSLWSEYREAGGETKAVTLHGIDLPAGLHESAQLAHPIFTPATKAASGHDVNIGMSELREIVGAERAEELAEASISVYRHAAGYARQRGIIIADTKFEFGVFNGTLVLIDEVLTPDSSRFWDAAKYEAGRAQESFDKQYLRDWLVASGWNKEPPAPELPPDVVKRTGEKYREAFRRITGSALE